MTAAAACWVSSEDKIKTALSEQSSFRELMDAADPLDALGKIKDTTIDISNDGEAYTYDEEVGESLRHYALMYSPEDSPYTLSIANVAPEQFDASGRTLLTFVRHVADRERFVEQYKTSVTSWVKRKVDQVMADVLNWWRDVADTTYLHVIEIAALNSPRLVTVDGVERVTCTIQITWDQKRDNG